jgi:exo-1,4-beta-D-glucosaminidase
MPRSILLSAIALISVASVVSGQKRLTLHNDWLIQSSAKVGADGATISAPSYRPSDWYRATVPSTVVGTLVDDGLYGDPFFGDTSQAARRRFYDRSELPLRQSDRNIRSEPWWQSPGVRAFLGASARVRAQVHASGPARMQWLTGRFDACAGSPPPSPGPSTYEFTSPTPSPAESRRGVRR